MRVAIVLVFFLITAVPLFQPTISLPTADIVVDVDSYILWFAGFWIAVFLLDVIRVAQITRPRKERIDGFAAIETGVPHGRYAPLPGGGFVVLLRNSIPLQSWQAIGGMLGLPCAILFILYDLNSHGWVGSSSMTRIGLEIISGMVALLYICLGLPPTRIEVTTDAVTVNRQRLSRAPKHFEGFIGGERLAYKYGTRTTEFGGHWTLQVGHDIAAALNELIREHSTDSEKVHGAGPYKF